MVYRVILTGCVLVVRSATIMLPTPNMMKTGDLIAPWDPFNLKKIGIMKMIKYLGILCLFLGLNGCSQDDSMDVSRGIK